MSPLRTPPDIVGQTYGKLTVKAWFDYRYGQHTWICLCSCGKQTKPITSRRLTMGKTTSCGCAKKRTETNKHGWTGKGKISGSYWKSLQGRKHKLEVSLEYISALFDKQKGLCALSGVPIGFGYGAATTASLDRIDSALPYVEGNLQWVHKWINRMKNVHSVQEFIDWCGKVTDHDRQTSNQDKARVRIH